MNLLLLLSALLSALTGVGGRAAGAPSVQAVAQESGRIAVAAKVATRPSIRPMSPRPELADVAHATPVTALSLTTIPAWATRRRE